VLSNGYIDFISIFEHLIFTLIYENFILTHIHTQNNIYENLSRDKRSADRFNRVIIEQQTNGQDMSAFDSDHFQGQ